MALMAEHLFEDVELGGYGNKEGEKGYGKGEEEIHFCDFGCIICGTIERKCECKCKS
jgi:hypothetical protein